MRVWRAPLRPRRRSARTTGPTSWLSVRGLGSEERIALFTTRALELFGKAVLIAPSDHAATRLVAAVVPEQMPVWQPEEFAEAPGGVLALANRYDGIDLPDEACRLVVLAGLPVGMHLQERFLHESVKALAVLTERIRTRLTQGAGRATRNSADYAAVIMLGRDLANFCAEPGVQAASHPEIRAELCFGLDNSTGTQAREAMENLRHFHRQDEEWRAAEQDIIASREEVARARPPGTGQLAAAAPHEVAAVDAAWQGDWPAAIDAAGKALGQLAGDDVRHYQALWHYILASWAVIAARTGNRDRWQPVAEAHFADARAAAAGTRWLPGLTTSASQLIAIRPHHARTQSTPPRSAASPPALCAPHPVRSSPLSPSPSPTAWPRPARCRTRRRWRASVSSPAPPCSSALERTPSPTQCGCSARTCGPGSKPSRNAARMVRSPRTSPGRQAATSTTPRPAPAPWPRPARSRSSSARRTACTAPR